MPWPKNGCLSNEKMNEPISDTLCTIKHIGLVQQLLAECGRQQEALRPRFRIGSA
jgi:hypothetical protein